MRGHDWLPGEDSLAGVPRLYATDGQPFDNKIVHLHFFVGACDWYVAELDEDRRIAFGYANLGDPQCAEWGYIDLNELRDLAVRHPVGFPLVVERDLHWTPRPFSEIKEIAE